MENVLQRNLRTDRARDYIFSVSGRTNFENLSGWRHPSFDVCTGLPTLLVISYVPQNTVTAFVFLLFALSTDKLKKDNINLYLVGLISINYSWLSEKSRILIFCLTVEIFFGIKLKKNINILVKYVLVKRYT